MTALVQNIRRHGLLIPPKARGISRRAIVVAAMVGVISMVPDGWHLALDALSEAFLSVAVFVAGTLALVFGAERAFKTDLGDWLQRHQRWQVPAATLLGAFPGCGGAIVAVTQYTRGYLSFGAVVATLTATMGDAMFLLLAREPQTALGVLAMSMVVGVVSGYVIDAIHGTDFLRPQTAQGNQRACEIPAAQAAEKGLEGKERVWLVLMVPGIIIGILAAFQLEVGMGSIQWLGESPVYWLGVMGAVLSLAMWAGAKGQEDGDCAGGERCGVAQAPLARDVVENTNVVTAWVVFAFVGFEVLLAVSGIDLTASLSVWAPLVPAMAIAVGMIPGCGPQIMVTSLYLSGSVPLSAQLGNAIANDGDALFPALAVAPRAAIVASVYSAIPALIVAYSWYLWVELA